MGDFKNEVRLAWPRTPIEVARFPSAVKRREMALLGFAKTRIIVDTLIRMTYSLIAEG